MKKSLRTILITFIAAISMTCAAVATQISFKPYRAAAETNGTVTSSPIIQTSALGQIDVSSLRMKEGASVRLKDLYTPEDEEMSRNGLRFTAFFNKKIYNTLEELDEAYDSVSVGYGMLIVPYDYHQKTPVTVENVFGENAAYYIDGKTEKSNDTQKKIGGWYHLDLPEEDGDTREKEVYCSIINIAKTQLTRQWIGVAYIEYIENGVAQYYMTEIQDDNVRSMVYVAQKAIQDTSSKAPDSDQKNWLKENYTTYADATVTVPTKKYTYTVNHIKVDPLGNETVEESTVSASKYALYSGTTGNYTENTVSADEEKTYSGYTFDDARSVVKDIVYANNMTALNYYYNQDHCDILFTGTKCTMKMEGKTGAHLSYVALDGSDSFAFSILPDVGYSSGTVTVRVDGKSVTATDGVYVVSLQGREKDSEIQIEATVKAGTVSDQVFEGANYESKGEQSQSGLGVIAGWLGFGGLTVDEAAGTIKSTGGSLELAGDFIRNALDEGYTHMVCDVSVSGGIGTLKKLEMINGGDTVFYTKVGTEKTRTDRIDLTEFKKADGSCASLLFRAYRGNFFGSGEVVSSSATVVLSNIKMYKSLETAKWKKFNAQNQEITNAYAAYENGNLIIETMEDGTYFEAGHEKIAYDLEVGVSISFAFKYLNAGNNTDSFFYHFTNSDMEKTSSELSSCRVDDNGFSHLCILPETVRAAKEKGGDDVKFHFGLYYPGTAIIIQANSGVSVHSVFDENGKETVVADTWGYPYGHGVYNEFLQVKDPSIVASGKEHGVQFNINTYDNHTIHLEITADFNFEGFWYGNNYWTGYKAGMYQFKDVDTIEDENGVKTYWTEIVYTHAYMDHGFNIHWRDDEGDGTSKVGTMQLHYTLTSDALMEYYSFVPETHAAGIETSETLQDGIKVESLTGVEGTMFTMPVLEKDKEKTITLTVYADWNFSSLQYGAGNLIDGGLQNFAPSYDSASGLYKETVTVKAIFKEGFKIYYTTNAFPDNVVKATIQVSVYVENFETDDENVAIKEVLQTDGWTKVNATNVQQDTVFDFPSMPATESISVYVTTNIPLADVFTYGTPDKQMLSVKDSMVTVSENASDGTLSYYTFFTYCNPMEDYDGFRIAVNYSGNDFPADAWVQIQYQFTEFKIQNTEDILYTSIFEREITEEENGVEVKKQQATLYSEHTNARFWLDTSEYAEIQGTITSSVAVTEGVLLYGHGWDTTGVVAVDPNSEAFVWNDEAHSSWTYTFTYHENLESGFCIYYADNGENSFAGTVTVTYQLYTIEDIVERAENWSVEEGGVAPTFKKNGHVEYSSVGKSDGTGYELYIDASVFEIAYKNGYSIIGVTFASDDILMAHILNGNGAQAKLEIDGTVEHTLFNVTISDLYKQDENGNLIFEDMVFRFDYAGEIEEGTQVPQVSVTLEHIAFIRTHAQAIAE